MHLPVRCRGAAGRHRSRRQPHSQNRIPNGRTAISTTATLTLVEVLEGRQLLSASGHQGGGKPLDSIFAHITAKRFKRAGEAKPLAASSPVGFTPAQVRKAYGIDQITFGNGTITGDGSGQTIAIIDAYDNPKLVNSTDPNFVNSDLHKFDVQFGLPDPPSFRKVNQTGGSTMPGVDPSGPGTLNWEAETILDVEWAHAIAPAANIILVACNSASFSDLVQTGANWARNAAGVTAISMSFGAGEFSGESSLDTYFTGPAGHPGVTFVAATGDSGAPGGYPAYSPNVLAVGGTHLNAPGGTYSSETAWSGSGGGTSNFESKPGYQASIAGSTRGIPDVAFDADPNSGVAIYDSYNNPSTSAWAQFGGTSLSAPCWAGLIAIANQGRATAGLGSFATQAAMSKLYTLPASDFHDITSGSNGHSATAGYDLVTGLGSPRANLLIPDLAGLPPGAPAAPSAPALTSASDRGVSSSDGITNDNTPTFTGTAATGSTVSLYANGNLLGTTPADGSGNWSFTPGSAMADATYNMTATATNAGGTSAASTAKSITIDTVAPAAPGTPDLVAGNDSGSSQTDDITKITNPTFSGTAEPNSIVRLLADASQVGQAGAGTSGSYSISVASLTEGPHVLSATAGDVAGNVSSSSGALVVTIDTTAPALASAPVFDYLTGHSLAFAFTENVKPSVSIFGLALQNVTAGTSISPATMQETYGGSNTATFTFPGQSDSVLPDGNYQALLAGVQDAAGNTMAAPAAASFFVLSGDANHDRAVDTLDFNALAANFGGLDRNYAQADFNYDGKVDTLDFNVLAANFGKSLPADAGSSARTAGTAAASPAASTSVSLFSQNQVTDADRLTDLVV